MGNPLCYAQPGSCQIHLQQACHNVIPSTQACVNRRCSCPALSTSTGCGSAKNYSNAASLRRSGSCPVNRLSPSSNHRGAVQCRVAPWLASVRKPTPHTAKLAPSHGIFQLSPASTGAKHAPRSSPSLPGEEPLPITVLALKLASRTDRLTISLIQSSRESAGSRNAATDRPTGLGVCIEEGYGMSRSWEDGKQL